MTSSDKRTAANRANAQKSTGPRTAQGKQRSGKNALIHGILSRDLVIDTEDPSEFAALLDGLLEAHQPAGAAEQLLVEKIAMALWKMKRLNAVESASVRRGLLLPSVTLVQRHPHLQAELDAVDSTIAGLPPNADRLIRYQAQLEGQYYRATAALLTLQTHRKDHATLEMAAATVAPAPGAEEHRHPADKANPRKPKLTSQTDKP